MGHDLHEISHILQFSSATWVFVMPLILMVIDFISGILNAWIKNEVSSTKMRTGLVKKIGEILILIIGEAIVFGTTLSIKEDIMGGISFYISLMEAISVCENLALLGVPIPGFIKTSLKQTQDLIEKEKKDDEDRSDGDS